MIILNQKSFTNLVEVKKVPIGFIIFIANMSKNSQLFFEITKKNFITGVCVSDSCLLCTALFLCVLQKI